MQGCERKLNNIYTQITHDEQPSMPVLDKDQLRNVLRAQLRCCQAFHPATTSTWAPAPHKHHSSASNLPDCLCFHNFHSKRNESCGPCPAIHMDSGLFQTKPQRVCVMQILRRRSRQVLVQLDLRSYVDQQHVYCGATPARQNHKYQSTMKMSTLYGYRLSVRKLQALDMSLEWQREVIKLVFMMDWSTQLDR